jgi:hypothetical protein
MKTKARIGDPETMFSRPLKVPTPQQLSVAISRLLTLSNVAELRANGFLAGEALRAARLSAATHWRWAKRFSRHGLTGLLSRKDLCGRKPNKNPTNRKK